MTGKALRVEASRAAAVIDRVGPGQAGADDSLSLKSLAAFVAERSVVDYLVDDLLVRGFVYSLTGNTGAGKTAVAVPLALRVCAGVPIGRHDCEATPTIYIAGENPADVRPRFTVALQELRLSERLPLHVLDRSFVLGARIDELVALIERVGAGLVIVDTDAAVSLAPGSEENSNAERMEHAKRLRDLARASTRPTILDLCHPRKRATRDELQPRGGSAFLNEIDGNLCLWRDGDTVELFSDPDKFRGAPVAMTFVKALIECDAVLDRKGRPVPVPYYRLVDDDEAEQQRKQQWTEENRLLWAMKGEPGGSFAEWASACQWFTASGAPRKDKVGRLLRKLEADKLVRQARSGRYRLTPAGEQEASRP